MHDVLVHVRSLNGESRALRYGSALALASGAAVTGVHVVPGYYDAGLEPELIAMLVEQSQQRVAEAVAAAPAIAKAAADLGVSTFEWRVAEGRFADALEQAAASSDLLVMEHAADALDAVADVPHRVLLCGTPCLVLPRRDFDFHADAPMAIGWNGSSESLRAVHAALPLLRGRRVLLMRGEERLSFPTLNWTPAFDIAAHLRSRGVAVETVAIDACGDAAGAALLEQAQRFGAELLVMGAYGRSRFSEWILGGVTRHVLASAEIPVLLCH